ncbi:MAG: preprotein translocase subunit SecA [Acidimicrobiia bacterium]|nr:preprotein translocase subunit SecA [Acidimicrobiia bacterium]
MSIFSKLLRAGEGRTLKNFQQLVDQVNARESEYEALDDAALRAKTDEFRSRLENGETLDDIQVEAFAVVREAAKRTLGQRHYDVQVIGAAALHAGMVAEMRTGEGKTLVSTMPAYLNALAGSGVHMVTVNDYLAKRDAEWMGQLHTFLGLKVGLIQNNMAPEDRQPAYAADITYGTNNEFGFDYLRDNMAMSTDLMVQRGHPYAVVDEVDSILIDEARTPLIISGRLSDSAKWYQDFARIVEGLIQGVHYEVDEKKRQVLTMEEGVTRVEKILGVENLYDHAAVDYVHHLEQALRAKELYQVDVDYLLDGGEVKIVDEFTGRVMEGRRYSEGLHQAIEAKENVAIREENQTMATVTLQNYFRLYEKLAGMTGTAETEAAELAQIYGLEVLSIPTNEPVVRADQADLVYKTEDAKYDALVDDIKMRHEKGQPVLLGTASIEKSEKLSRILTKRGIPHEVLNAKKHAREADIIAQAGRPGAVTVATNMAGRGVDIMLGGNAEALARIDLRRQEIDPSHPEYPQRLEAAQQKFDAEIERDRERVKESGGLYVLGTERHDSRRIDNQLRGRSGRQGDAGESRFYLSAEDDLMRRFQGEKIQSMMERVKLEDDVPIEHKWINTAVERAQRQVESRNFEIRKNVLKYDEVMNRQREVIYEWRYSILEGEGSDGLVERWIEDAISETVEDAMGEEWDWETLEKELGQFYETSLLADGFSTIDQIAAAAVDEATEHYRTRREIMGDEVAADFERRVVLSVIDNKWRDHLSEMDYLRSGIGLRAMGQRDPLTEFQREGFEMFYDMVASVKRDAVRYVLRAEISTSEHEEEKERERASRQRPMVSASATAATATAGAANRSAPAEPVSVDKIGRNELCPCGSGKKYKKCHGAT